MDVRTKSERYRLGWVGFRKRFSGVRGVRGVQGVQRCGPSYGRNGTDSALATNRSPRDTPAPPTWVPGKARMLRVAATSRSSLQTPSAEFMDLQGRSRQQGQSRGFIFPLISHHVHSPKGCAVFIACSPCLVASHQAAHDGRHDRLDHAEHSAAHVHAPRSWPEAAACAPSIASPSA